MARKPYVEGSEKMPRALRRLNFSPTIEEESICRRWKARRFSSSLRNLAS
jgi:hypothetical protein